jgi:hypothetical protein
MSAIEKPWASMSPSGQPSAAQPGEQFERAAAVGLGAAAGLGHRVVAAVLGRCPKNIRRGDRSSPCGHALYRAIGKLVEAVDVHGVARRRSPSEQARRHRRGRAWPVGSLALEKRLFLNVRRERLLGSPFGKKSCDINERLDPF